MKTDKINKLMFEIHQKKNLPEKKNSLRAWKTTYYLHFAW